ncbi:MAG: family transporter [Novosphingobium sp.]|nr:family transporter [Novosphingobium sp.]
MERHHAFLPFAATALGIATFSVMDVAMKSASLTAGVFTALLLRCAIGSAIMLPIWLLGGGRWPSGPTFRVHLTRSAVSAAMATLFFWGLVRTPIAEAIALSFISPLIALYLASVLLGEKIERRAIAASVLGLVGVAVIALAPSMSASSLGAAPRSLLGVAAILASAVFYAWNLILQRQQAQAAEPREIAFFQNALVGVLLCVAAPWLLHRPDLPTLGTIALAAVLVTASLIMLGWAYARAEAQALVPLEYTAFIWAALFGWLWFGEQVTTTTLAGAALIVVGCLIATRTRTEQTAL